MLIDRRINMKLNNGGGNNKGATVSKCMAALGEEQKDKMQHFLNKKLGVTCEHSKSGSYIEAYGMDKNINRIEKGMERKKTVINLRDAEMEEVVQKNKKKKVK